MCSCIEKSQQLKSAYLSKASALGTKSATWATCSVPMILVTKKKKKKGEAKKNQTKQQKQNKQQQQPMKRKEKKRAPHLQNQFTYW